MARNVRYRSLGSVYLSLGLTIEGKSVTVDFIGGSGGYAKRLPFFQTSDPAIQQAMEKSSGLGLYYTVEWEEITADEKPKTPEQPEKQADTCQVDTGIDGIDVFGDITPDASTPPTGEIIAEGITNAQDAKAYLTEMFRGQVGQMTNKTSILAEAKRLGVSFVDWK